MRKRKALRRFLEDEAELGSDNEENDDVRKDIAIDGEEDEEGLDEDLKDFVVHEGDDAEIGDESEDMRLKHQRDMEALDRLEIQRTMEAVIFGRNNKKRKRDEVDGLDDYDNGDRRKMRLIEERMKQLQDGNAEPEDIILAAA
jgi:hypothetical protein